MHRNCSYNASTKIDYTTHRWSVPTLVVVTWRIQMTKSLHVVKMPIKAALRYRAMFHGVRILQIVGAPWLFYVFFIYRDVHLLRKFDLPPGCLFSALDQQAWWNISPMIFLLMGIILYWMIVWIFHDRKNESGIVNLVNKNINSDELVEVKI